MNIQIITDNFYDFLIHHKNGQTGQSRLSKRLKYFLLKYFQVQTTVNLEIAPENKSFL